MLKLPSLGELDRGAAVQIYLCTAATDMRKGFDTLALLVREHLGRDPLSGHLFLFVGRRRDRLKLLYWDQDGYALWYKRLEEGTYRLPALTVVAESPGQSGPSKACRACVKSPVLTPLRYSQGISSSMLLALRR